MRHIKNHEFFKAAKSVRDEFTAHLDLLDMDGKYEYPDISKYGLKWDSLKEMFELLQPILEKVGLVVRDANFAWDSFEVQNEKIAFGFWGDKKC